MTIIWSINKGRLITVLKHLNKRLRTTICDMYRGRIRTTFEASRERSWGPQVYRIDNGKLRITTLQHLQGEPEKHYLQHLHRETGGHYSIVTIGTGWGPLSWNICIRVSDHIVYHLHRGVNIPVLHHVQRRGWEPLSYSIHKGNLMITIL